MKEGTIMSEKSSSGIIQMAIALIGILGSLGVAYITTGYQFKEELHKAQVNVNDLQKQGQDIHAAQTDVSGQISNLKKLLSDADAKNSALQEQLVAKNGELQKRLETLTAEIEKSKTDINSSKTAAIGEINNARVKAITMLARPPQ
jgi:predicted  nucleic acid-binding Zn-ribbon protein